MIVRDFWLRGKSSAWPAIVIAVALFSPFIPVAVTQSRSLLFDHWLDWIGAQSPQLSLGVKANLVVAIAMAGLWLVFGKRSADERSEALRWCMSIVLMPILLMVGACVLVRPMFQIRYLAPCWALTAVALAFALDTMGTRFRRLSVLAIAGSFAAAIPMYQSTSNDSWRDIAGQMETRAAPAEAVVFEAGFSGPTARLVVLPLVSPMVITVSRLIFISMRLTRAWQYPLRTLRRREGRSPTNWIKRAAFGWLAVRNSPKR